MLKWLKGWEYHANEFNKLLVPEEKVLASGYVHSVGKKIDCTSIMMIILTQSIGHCVPHATEKIIEVDYMIVLIVDSLCVMLEEEGVESVITYSAQFL